MKSIVTGSHGFLGQHLCHRLIQMGYEIIRLDRWEKPPKKFDYFFHLAGYGNHSNQKNIEEMRKANFELVWFYINETIHTSYKAFVNFSTSSVLLPTQTMYSITKHAGERICRVFAKDYDKPIISIYPYSVYGPGEAAFRFIPTVIRSIIKYEVLTLDPHPSHDWIFVEDFIDAVIYSAEHYSRITQYAIPIGTGVQTSNNKVVKIISDIMKKTPNTNYQENMREYDTHKWVADTRIFNWYTRPLREGLEETIKFYSKVYG